MDSRYSSSLTNASRPNETKFAYNLYITEPCPSEWVVYNLYITEPCPSEWVVYEDNCYGAETVSCGEANNLASSTAVVSQEEHDFLMANLV